MQKKKRHGCLTAWLIYLIFAYSISSIIYFFNSNQLTEMTQDMSLIYCSFSILGIFFSILLFNWVKLGFWGIMTISLILSIIQISNGTIFSSFLILLCLIILYCLLQIKKSNISGWNNLE